jgi:hypothetical protein
MGPLNSPPSAWINVVAALHELVEVVKAEMIITLLHPRATIEHLGFIPGFLDEADPRAAREQFDEHYVSGWHPLPKFRLDGERLLYPGDPPLRPYARINFREEAILIYEGDFVVIVQPDGSFEGARMN